MKKFTQIKLTKKALLLCFIAVVCCGEILAGYLYFQRSWEKGSSLKWFWHRVEERYLVQSTSTALPTKDEYINAFQEFIDISKHEKITLSLLYIPQLDGHFSDEKKFFFNALAQKNNIEFIDVTAKLANYPKEWLYNLPFDFHLSPLGHALVSGEIARVIDFNTQMSKDLFFSELDGPHPKHVDSVNRFNQLAYRIQTNAQGFRMIDDINKAKHSVMILGDSFTFGTGVDTFEAFPHRLSQDVNHLNIINAGIPGSSILEQLDFFEKMKNKTGITHLILQVLDNDVLLDGQIQ